MKTDLIPQKREEIPAQLTTPQNASPHLHLLRTAAAGLKQVPSRLAPDQWLALQRTLGNRCVQRLVASAGEQSDTSVPLEASATASLQRTVLQRQEAPDPEDPFDDPTKRPDPLTGPGAPFDTNDRGLSCGVDKGKPGCSLDVGKGKPLTLPGTGPSSSKPQSDVKGASDCPPGKYNKVLMTCCGGETHASEDGTSCVRDQPAPFTVPPAPPSQKGDFPVPDPNADTQYA